MAAPVKKTAEIGKGKAGPGRPKGVPNKLTADLKAMILTALDKAGGVKYLQRQSTENPTAFLTLVGKVLPLTVANPDGTNLPAPQFIIQPVALAQKSDE
jgi:hypothetical protein